MLCIQLPAVLENIDALNDQLDGELLMHLLVSTGHVLDGCDDRLQLFFWFFELLVEFYDLLGCDDLFFWLARFVKGRDQLVGVRYTFGAHLNWFRLFRRNRKSAARFE